MGDQAAEAILLSEEVGAVGVSYRALAISLIRGAIAISIFVALVLLRKKVADGILKLINVLGAGLDDKVRQSASEELAGPISFICIMIGTYVAGLLTDMPDYIEDGFHHLMQSLINILVFWIIYRLIDPVLKFLHQHGTHSFGEELQKVVGDLSKAFILILGFLSVLQAWGINVSAFLAGLGLVGMAVALAAQDTFRNLFGSFVIFADKAFQTGDWIKTPDVEGTVMSVGLRTTSIRNFDTSVVLIPNGNLANSTITNFNKCSQRRINWTLPITGATATALENIVRRLNEYIRNHPDIEKEKQPIIIRLDSFGENCVQLFCYFFTKTTDWIPYLEIKEGILLEFKKIVAEEKASFGVPTRLVLLNEINK
jgi:MscS family membrane protein